MLHDLLAVNELSSTVGVLLESLPDAMIISDAGGRIVFVNGQAERLFGYSREELLSGAVEMLVPERMRSGHVGNREGYVNDPRVRPMGAGLELHGRRKNGTEFPIEISLSPIPSENGTLVASAIRDATQRKRFEHALREKNLELEHASMAKDRFLASMSHELRTPLNAIIGFTGTLLMKLPGPLTTDQENQLRIVQSSAKHLLSLINDILDLAKIESGKVELHFEDLFVRDVIEDVIKAMRPVAEEKGLALVVELPDERFPVHADRRALHQILLNLTSNAIKYTETGTVTFALSNAFDQRGRPAIDVSVTDTGIGLKEEDQDKLFSAFEQVDPSNTRRFEGAGLGLYLSQKLAKLLDGNIHFTSSYGVGSTFTFTMPKV